MSAFMEPKMGPREARVGPVAVEARGEIEEYMLSKNAQAGGTDGGDRA